MNLPDDYRKLQKVAGEVDDASGKGSTEEIRSSLEEAPDDKVESAMQELGFTDEEVAETSGNTVKDIVAEKAASETDGDTSSSQENGEDEPSLEYTSDRDSTGDLLGRENPEEEVLEQSENDEGEVVLGSDEENQDEKDGETQKVEAEPVEVDPEIWRWFHVGINKGLRKIFGKKFGVQVPELEESDLNTLESNTQKVADRKLSMEQKRKLESRSGVFGMLVPHLKQVGKGMVFNQDTGENTSESGEESSENAEKPSEQDSGGDTGEPDFGSEHPFE